MNNRQVGDYGCMKEKSAGAIRLVTFNIKHSAEAHRYRGSPSLAVEACSQLGADILALQEVDTHTVRTGLSNLPTRIAGATGMQPIFSPALRFMIGSYGNALFVRGDINNVEHIKMRGGRRFKTTIGQKRVAFRHAPRTAIVADVTVENKRFAVATTHLATEKDISHRQLEQILGSLACLPDPLVLMGDFNRTRREMRDDNNLERYDLIKTPPTFPAGHPRRAIDHVALSGFQVDHVEVVELAVSDHRALIVDVR